MVNVPTRNRWPISSSFDPLPPFICDTGRQTLRSRRLIRPAERAKSIGPPLMHRALARVGVEQAIGFCGLSVAEGEWILLQYLPEAVSYRIWARCATTKCAVTVTKFAR